MAVEGGHVANSLALIMQRNLDSSPLPWLLSILKDKESLSPIASVVNAMTIDATHQLLFKNDYVNVATHLTDSSDATNLLDFILYLLRNGYLSRLGPELEANRRARRLMLKVISKTPVIPKSLFITGVTVKVEVDYIASGGFGLVFKGELQGVLVALKSLRKVSHTSIDFCREALTWRSLGHKFVLPLLGVCEHSSLFFLVSPYMKNGTLAQWRKVANPSTTEIEDRISEVAQGIQYIHSEGVVHGDIRGDNILLDDDFHVQIADFGLTRHLEATVTHSGARHQNFAAPELFGDWDCDDDTLDDIQTRARTQKSDIYAFGCLYYEIHYDAIPFGHVNEFRIMKSVARGERPPRQDEPPLTDDAWKLIQDCWMQEKTMRPAIEDIVEKMMRQDDPKTPKFNSYNIFATAAKPLSLPVPKSLGEKGNIRVKKLVEVWPESVEKIFVEGLRKFWESPYATSSRSRGRSRWRNQFLVDYLRSVGVERSKKQVASYIQFLRQKWKGEPEFHLVAGGDELFPELQRTNVKQEEQGFTFGYNDGDFSNGTPFSFPLEVNKEFPPSPGVPIYPSLPNVDGTYYATSNPQRSYRITDFSPSVNPNDFSAPNFASHGQFTPDGMPSQAVSYRYVEKTERVKALKLTAEGLAPLWVRLDTLISLGQLGPHTPLTLKFQLRIDTGRLKASPCFAPCLYFTGWTCSKSCRTTLFINGVTTSSEHSLLTLAGSEGGYATAALPESLLTLCQRLDLSFSAVVTQEVVADNQTLLFIVYIMDHATSGDLPSARLLSYHKHDHSDKAAAAQLSPEQSHTEQHGVTSHYYNNAYMSTAPRHGGQAS